MRALGVVLCGSLLLVSGVARAQCVQSADCKGGRVCANGTCVDAASVAQPAPVVVMQPAPQPPQPAPANPVEPARKPLKTTGGTMMLSGSLSVMPKVTAPLSGSGSAKSGVLLSLTPGMGIFVAKHFALEFDLGLSKGAGDLYNSTSWTLGMDLGFGVYPNLGTFGALYVRLLVGPQVSIPSGSGSSSVPALVSFNVSIPFGVLIAVNEHVAVDVGLRIQTTVWTQGSSSGVILQVPIGYFGVRSFF